MGITLGRKNVLCGVAAFVSALLLWAAYPPHSEVFAILVALVPILVTVRIASPKRSALTCFAFGLLYWVLSLSWMPAIIKNNGPWPLVLLGWFALAAACAAYFALFGYLASMIWSRGRRFGAPSVLCLFCEPILWAGCEYMRATLFTGFAWNFLGTAFAAMPSFAAPARFGGVYLVSALVVLLNGVFATLLLRIAAPMMGDGFVSVGASRMRRRAIQIMETGLPLLAILACQYVGNKMVVDSRQADQEGVSVRVALVQRNAPCVFNARRGENPYEAFAGLIDVAAAAKPDILVFAESAMSEFGQVRSFRAQDVAREFLIRSGARALIAGGDDVVSNRTYNAAAFYAMESGAGGMVSTQVYHKQHLVPFGEYIPFDKLIPALQGLSPIGVSLYAGEPMLFEFTASGGRKIKIAPLICYEDTDPRLAAIAKRKGADMIVLITNDSWFANSAEAEAHAAQAVLRAVETGLPIVRVGNSGVSGVIRSDGTARWLTDENGRPLTDSPGVMVETVSVR